MAEGEDLDELTLLDPAEEAPEQAASPGNKAILENLALLNKNMLAVTQSLQLFQQNLPLAEPARKRAFAATDTASGEENVAQSDADKLLNKQPPQKRQKVVNNDNSSDTQLVVNNDNGNGDDATAMCIPSDNITEEDPLLDEIALAMNDGEKTSAKVSEQLAKIIDSRWLNKLAEETLREKLDTYVRPVNCEHLVTPKVNPEIWGRLDKETRGKDLKLSYLQNSLVAAGSIVSRTTDMLLNARAENSTPDMASIIRMNMDAIAIMGHISYSLAQRRRDTIRPTLNKEYATLCASHVPVTQFLFGDELQTELNHIRASNRIRNTTGGRPQYTPKRNGPSQQQQARSGQHKPFLWKSPPQSGKPYYKKPYNQRPNQRQQGNQKPAQ